MLVSIQIIFLALAWPALISMAIVRDSRHEWLDISLNENSSTMAQATNNSYQHAYPCSLNDLL